jgi:hypothetical protein
LIHSISATNENPYTKSLDFPGFFVFAILNPGHCAMVLVV